MTHVAAWNATGYLKYQPLDPHRRERAQRVSHAPGARRRSGARERVSGSSRGEAPRIVIRRPVYNAWESLQVPTVPRTTPAAKPASRSRLSFLRGRSWKFYVSLGVGSRSCFLRPSSSYYYVTFSRMIDARMHGEFAADRSAHLRAAADVRRGQRMTQTQMIDRLNDLGYAQRAPAEQPGQFAIGRDALVVIPRSGDRASETSGSPSRRATPAVRAGRLTSIEIVSEEADVSTASMLDAPLLTALVNEGREKRRDVPLPAIPPRMIQAVIAIEDRRFYDHSGVDSSARRAPWSAISSAARNTCRAAARSRSSSSATRSSRRCGGSTRRGRGRTRRQAQVHRVADVDRARAAAVEGQGPRAVPQRRLARAARIVCHPRRARSGAAVLRQGRQQPVAGRSGDDRRRHPGAAPLLAVQQPGPRRRNAATSCSRRWPTADSSARTRPIVPRTSRCRSSRARSTRRRRTSSTTSSQELQERSQGRGAVDVYTTLDLHLQRIAQDAVATGSTASTRCSRSERQRRRRR